MSLSETRREIRAEIRPWIVVVGGFLGAGKTTLLLAAARELERRGLRSAAVLNDQGEALVDTEFAAAQNVKTGEVTGGCFCCRFSALVEVMEDLRRFSPDVIFAEPVGSCTDISATMLQPLLEYSPAYRLAPFTVLVDPLRAAELMGGGDADMKFLFQNQLREADVVCFSKADVSATYPAMDGIDLHSVRQLSARTGEGVAAWLDEILSGSLSAGTRILDIDYERYARAEAALAWLNLEVKIEAAVPVSPAGMLGPLLDALDADFTSAGIRMVHLKAILRAETGYVKAAICANGAEPVVEGNLDASPALRHRLLLNLRAVGAVAEVRGIVEGRLARIEGELSDVELACFSPAAPVPEHRIAERRL
jgi:hypothetical protein